MGGGTLLFCCIGQLNGRTLPWVPAAKCEAASRVGRLLVVQHGVSPCLAAHRVDVEQRAHTSSTAPATPGLLQPCPHHALGCTFARPGFNPATWMLEVTGASMSTTFRSAGHDFAALYQASAQRWRSSMHAIPPNAGHLGQPILMCHPTALCSCTTAGERAAAAERGAHGGAGGAGGQDLRAAQVGQLGRTAPACSRKGWDGWRCGEWGRSRPAAAALTATVAEHLSLWQCALCRLAGRYATSRRTQRAMLLKKFLMLYWRNPNYSQWG